MTGDTDHLIEQLATDLAPVDPLWRPAKRAAVWAVGAVIYLSVLAFVVSRFAVATGGIDTSLMVSQFVGIVAAVLAAIAAFASVVPGYSKRVLIGPAFAGAAWIVFLALAALRGGDEPVVASAQHEWFCVAIILLGGIPLIAALAGMLRRGAPLNPALTGLLGALAVGLFASFSACISLPHADGAVMLAWHGGAIVALAIACVAGARFVLRWHA